MFSCTCSLCKDQRGSNRLLSCKGKEPDADKWNHSTSARNNQRWGTQWIWRKSIIQKNEELIRLSLPLPLPKQGYNQEQAQPRATSGIPSRVPAQPGPCDTSRMSRESKAGQDNCTNEEEKVRMIVFIYIILEKKYFKMFKWLDEISRAYWRNNSEGGPSKNMLKGCFLSMGKNSSVHRGLCQANKIFCQQLHTNSPFLEDKIWLCVHLRWCYLFTTYWHIMQLVKTV